MRVPARKTRCGVSAVTNLEVRQETGNCNDYRFPQADSEQVFDDCGHREASAARGHVAPLLGRGRGAGQGRLANLPFVQVRLGLPLVSDAI